jgi:hypothetical protein
MSKDVGRLPFILAVVHAAMPGVTFGGLVYPFLVYFPKAPLFQLAPIHKGPITIDQTENRTHILYLIATRSCWYLIFG